MPYMDSGLKIHIQPYRLPLQLRKCLAEASVPEWMSKEKTTLIEKDSQKGTIPSNYRPITCLPMMWKILTTQIREKIYYSLVYCELRGAFDKFPDFFVRAFIIVVDSWKFTMLLLYLLWDDWPIFMISGLNKQLQQQLEYTLLKPDCHSWWISKMHQFLSGIRDSRKVGSLWRTMRGVGGVKKSIDQSWLAKGLGLGLLCWGFKGVQEEIPLGEASTLQIGSVAFPPGQCTSPQLHPCHRLFVQDGHQHNSPDLAPRDFWLFPKLTGCHYGAFEEMKEAVTKVTDTLTQEDFHWAFQKL